MATTKKKSPARKKSPSKKKSPVRKKKSPVKGKASKPSGGGYTDKNALKLIKAYMLYHYHSAKGKPKPNPVSKAMKKFAKSGNPTDHFDAFMDLLSFARKARMFKSDMIAGKAAMLATRYIAKTHTNPSASNVEAFKRAVYGVALK